MKKDLIGFKVFIFMFVLYRNLSICNTVYPLLTKRRIDLN